MVCSISIGIFKKTLSVFPTARRFSNIPELSFASLSRQKEGKSRPRRPPAISDLQYLFPHFQTARHKKKKTCTEGSPTYLSTRFRKIVKRHYWLHVCPPARPSAWNNTVPPWMDVHEVRYFSIF
jgi:hypothetical protein